MLVNLLQKTNAYVQIGAESFLNIHTFDSSDKKNIATSTTIEMIESQMLLTRGTYLSVRH